jgi:hypothetical protein
MPDIESLRKQEKDLKAQRDAARSRAAQVLQRQRALKASYDLNWASRTAIWKTSAAGANFKTNYREQFDGMTDEHKKQTDEVKRLENKISDVQSQMKK